MKTTTKIISASCVFCYFAGLWIIATRFGLIKLISRYGVSELLDGIPKDFPQMKYLYIGLGVYTVLFAAISYFIIKYSEGAANEQTQLQQESGAVASYSESMNTLLAQYDRSDIKDTKKRQKLQLLQRSIASLPPAVIRTANLKSEVANTITGLQDLLADKASADSFAAAIDNALDTIDSVKRRCKTINN